MDRNVTKLRYEFLITQFPLFQWVPGLFPGVKWPGRGLNHPPPSSAEVKERIDLYLYSPSGLHNFTRVSFTFTFYRFLFT
jgi:hypothetical protein